MPVITLEYHDVVAGTDWNSSGFAGRSADSYKMSAELFDKHLAAVQRAATDVGRDVRQVGTTALPERTILFTFDDGGSSALHETAGLLEQRGWRGHFLITTGRIGTPGFLSATDLSELHRRGHIIGSHTESHPPRMSHVPRDLQVAEWTRSRDRLEQILGVAVDVASVPGGYFDRQTAEAAAAAGIRWLFTSEPVAGIDTIDGTSVIGRFTLRQNSAAAMAAALVGVGPVARGSQWLKWNAKKLAKRVGGGSYLRVRAKVFGDVKPPREGHENR